ncbi:uncharacterized protein METZ01_LOCUS414784, partial [marine metagenome]
KTLVRKEDFIWIQYNAPTKNIKSILG